MNRGKNMVRSGPILSIGSIDLDMDYNGGGLWTIGVFLCHDFHLHRPHAPINIACPGV